MPRGQKQLTYDLSEERIQTSPYATLSGKVERPGQGGEGERAEEGPRHRSRMLEVIVLCDASALHTLEGAN